MDQNEEDLLKFENDIKLYESRFIKRYSNFLQYFAKDILILIIQYQMQYCYAGKLAEWRKEYAKAYTLYKLSMKDKYKTESVNGKAMACYSLLLWDSFDLNTNLRLDPKSDELSNHGQIIVKYYFSECFKYLKEKDRIAGLYAGKAFVLHWIAFRSYAPVMVPEKYKCLYDKWNQFGSETYRKKLYLIMEFYASRGDPLYTFALMEVYEIEQDDHPWKWMEKSIQQGNIRAEIWKSHYLQGSRYR